MNMQFVLKNDMMKALRILTLVFVTSWIPGAHMMAQSIKMTNPVLAGFYPYPSVLQVVSDYYLINSTFAYFPGIPICRKGSDVQIAHGV